MANPLMRENVWLQQQKFEDAYSLYLRLKAGTTNTNTPQPSGSSLAGDIAQVRQGIQQALSNQHTAATPSSGGGGDATVFKRLEFLERENKELRKITDELRALILTVQASASGKPSEAPAPKPAAVPAPKPAAAPAAASDDEEDSDEDLFGDSEEETEEDKAERQKRLKAYADKKAKKPGPIAKSSLILDVKPWDDETDMDQIEKYVRGIEADGLKWGWSKLVPVGYGIKKLQINCVVEDDKIGTDFLEEKITAFEDCVQSMDVFAFNKI